jgi:hypothetical protein
MAETSICLAEIVLFCAREPNQLHENLLRRQWRLAGRETSQMPKGASAFSALYRQVGPAKVISFPLAQDNMPVPDALLTAVTLRLAGLALAGFVIQALPSGPHSEAACAQASSVASPPAAANSHHDGHMDEILRDMMMHD